MNFSSYTISQNYRIQTLRENYEEPEAGITNLKKSFQNLKAANEVIEELWRITGRKRKAIPRALY